MRRDHLWKGALENHIPPMGHGHGVNIVNKVLKKPIQLLTPFEANC